MAIPDLGPLRSTFAGVEPVFADSPGAFPDTSCNANRVCTVSALRDRNIAGGGDNVRSNLADGRLCDLALPGNGLFAPSGLFGRLRDVARFSVLGVIAWPPKADATTVVPGVAPGAGSALSVRKSG